MIQLILVFPGELNEETAKLMATPRCGVKDKVGPAADGRSKRYALQGEYNGVSDISNLVIEKSTDFVTLRS